MMATIFYKMMEEIGQEMHQSTGALALSRTDANNPIVLDLCMAPGGFLATTLDLNPGAHATGFSLPVVDGGHKKLMNGYPNVTVKFLDVTMPAADIGIAGFAADHAEAKNLLPQQLDPGQLFDLVLCDGQILRTHVRAAHRET